MNKLISAIKSIRLGQVLTAFLAGVLLLISTACTGNAQAKMPQGDMTRGAGSNPVGQKQPYEGGMNNFSDTAPGQAAKGTAEKTKALIDRAKRDINTKGVDSVDQYVDNYRSGAPLGERTKKITDNVRGAAQNTADDVKGLGDRVSNATDRAGDKSKELGQNLKNGAENMAENTKRAGDSTARSAKNAAENIKDSTEYAAKDASRGVKGAVKEAAQATEDAAKSANRKVQRSID